MKTIFRKIVSFLPFLMFALAIGLILQIVISIRQDKIPTIFGYGIFLVVSPSMEDTIMEGDLIFVDTKAESYLDRDIITFYRPDRESMIVTHRIDKVEVIDGVPYYTTLGDNNAFSASWETAFSESYIIGKVVGWSSVLGGLYALVFTGGIHFLYAIVVLVFLLIATLEFINIIRTITKAKQGDIEKEKSAMVEAELEKLRQAQIEAQKEESPE